MRIGINGSGALTNPDIEAIVGDIVAAEAEGFDSYWLAQTALVDATAVLGLAGTRTSSIELGTAVVPTWERHPHAFASQALTAQAMAGAVLRPVGSRTRVSGVQSISRSCSAMMNRWSALHTRSGGANVAGLDTRATVSCSRLQSEVSGRSCFG